MKSPPAICQLGRWLSNLTIACLLYLPGSTLANFEKALEIYSSGDHAKAQSAFEALAAIGDRSSMFNLGVMYYRGEIGDKDAVMAYVMMRFANADMDDAAFQKTIDIVYKGLNEAQKDEAQTLRATLAPKYEAESIRNTIFPVLLDDEECTPDLKALVKFPPIYPREQQKSGRMGLTYLEHTVSPEGYPRDVLVIDSTNRDFARASAKALRKNIYPASTLRSPIFGQRYVVIYQLEGSDTKVKTRAIKHDLDKLETAAEAGDVFAQYKYGYQLNVFRRFQSYLTDIDLQYRSANEWFTKSAENGLARAQFEIGRNMMQGRGCELDEENGYKWVKAAAIAGYSPAQRLLAETTLADKDLSEAKALAAISWLRNAALSDYYPAKLMLAWELATSSSEAVRAGAEALALLNTKPKKYFDEVRIFETKAAAYAEMGEFRKAVKYQKKALKLSRKANWDIPLVQERLGLYEHNQPYRGPYY